MDITNYLDNAYSLANQEKVNAVGERVSSTLNSVNADYTKEDLEDAAKSFESYFVEQVIKEVKDSTELFGSDDEDSIMSQYTDFYMDSTISSLASEIVENMGGAFTDSMVAQMARNYGIDLDEEEAAVEAAGGAAAASATE